MPNHPPIKAPKYTAAQVIAAIVAKRGLVSAAAHELGCEPQTVRNYARRYPTVAAALTEERERTLDVAEAALYQAIAKGEAWAVCFTLKTLGKERGYVERTEATGKDGAPLALRLSADSLAALWAQAQAAAGAAE